MKKTFWIVLLGLLFMGVRTSLAQTPPFSECSPAVGSTTSCNYLITIGGTTGSPTVSITIDPSQSPIDTLRNAPAAGDDYYIGVLNNATCPTAPCPQGSATLLGLMITGPTHFTSMATGCAQAAACITKRPLELPVPQVVPRLIRRGPHISSKSIRFPLAGQTPGPSCLPMLPAPAYAA
jgi:hypothetical protein